eukprot:6473650-Amphidinium_carterae.1
MLVQVSLGSTPTLGGEAEEWLTLVQARLLWFAKFSIEVQIDATCDDNGVVTEASTHTVTFYGKAALDKNLEFVLTADDAALQMHHFWWLAIFTYALDASKVVEMQTKMKTVASRMDAMDAAPKPTMTVSKPAAKKRKAVADVEGEARKRAAALLA